MEECNGCTREGTGWCKQCVHSAELSDNSNYAAEEEDES